MMGEVGQTVEMAGAEMVEAEVEMAGAEMVEEPVNGCPHQEGTAGNGSQLIVKVRVTWTLRPTGTTNATSEEGLKLLLF